MGTGRPGWKCTRSTPSLCKEGVPSASCRSTASSDRSEGARDADCRRCIGDRPLLPARVPPMLPGSHRTKMVVVAAATAVAAAAVAAATAVAVAAASLFSLPLCSQISISSPIGRLSSPFSKCSDSSWRPSRRYTGSSPTLELRFVIPLASDVSQSALCSVLSSLVAAPCTRRTAHFQMRL